jgi:superfamily II DNA or RNA helicase
VSNYADFLASKRRKVHDVGPAATPDDVHPLLHDWQAEIVAWAVRKGRAAIFADCGLGKTFMQLEWARMVGKCTLILAPLSVARQTVREAQRIDIDVHYVRHGSEVTGPGIWITNYEMAEGFDPAMFDAVVLDESSILKNVEGKTRQRLTASVCGSCPFVILVCR